MSDLEKVLSIARSLGKTNPVRIRWEGAGDSVHACDLIKKLKAEKYPGTSDPISFEATVNLYEKKFDSIAMKATQYLMGSMWPSKQNQKLVINYEVDVTRPSNHIAQSKAHIVFVRNIMPTDVDGKSLTNDVEGLKNIHLGAVRNRSNSIEKGGQLAIGMSGKPGIVSDTQDNRKALPVQSLFVGANELVLAAETVGLYPAVSEDTPGRDVFVDGYVMKNNGVSLDVKPTYYLTFQNLGVDFYK